MLFILYLTFEGLIIIKKYFSTDATRRGQDKGRKTIQGRYKGKLKAKLFVSIVDRQKGICPKTKLVH